MTVENLSAVWGPTLMHAGENSVEEWNRAETKVIGDLIKLYPKLYQLSPADLAKEAKMLEILEKHHVSNNGLRGAPSGDLKIWIYIISPNGECVNVTVSINANHLSSANFFYLSICCQRLILRLDWTSKDCIRCLSGTCRENQFTTSRIVSRRIRFIRCVRATVTS